MKDWRLFVQGRRARKLTLLPQAIELRAKGLTYREIAKALGVALQTAHAWTRHVGKGDIFK